MLPEASHFQPQDAHKTRRCAPAPSAPSAGTASPGLPRPQNILELGLDRSMPGTWPPSSPACPRPATETTNTEIHQYRRGAPNLGAWRVCSGCALWLATPLGACRAICSSFRRGPLPAGCLAGTPLGSTEALHPEEPFYSECSSQETCGWSLLSHALLQQLASLQVSGAVAGMVAAAR